MKQNSFKTIQQAKKSSIRVGFTSSHGALYEQSANSFSNFISDPTSEFVYDFTQDTKFMLEFPPRPIPRIMMPGKASIELTAYKISPKLGSLSRPDTLNLHEYKLDSDDFCKIAQIPFDVLVKLREDTTCSCAVYYLYRIIRQMNRKIQML